jgi:methylated-DNA-[protein]-cysteine S-methyltransferase
MTEHGQLFMQTAETDLLGRVGAAASHRGLVLLKTHLEVPVSWDYKGLPIQRVREHPVAGAVLSQLLEYLEGKRVQFDVPIDWTDFTEFQRRVLQATRAIPYGETRTYGEIARSAGSPRAARAVGQAEKANPIPVIIPCHRVIGADGAMVGYGGPEGVDLKARLLKLEGALIT